MVLSNMGAEMGAKDAYCEAEGRTLDWLKGRAKADFATVFSDPDAQYEDILKYDIFVAGGLFNYGKTIK